MKALIHRSYEGTLTLKFAAVIPEDSRLRRAIRAIRSGLSAAAARLHRVFASRVKEV